MMRPVLHVARVDATVWAGSPYHASEFGSTSCGYSTSQDEKEHKGDDSIKIRRRLLDNLVKDGLLVLAKLISDQVLKYYVLVGLVSVVHVWLGVVI